MLVEIDNLDLFYF